MRKKKKYRVTMVKSLVQWVYVSAENKDEAEYEAYEAQDTGEVPWDCEDIEWEVKDVSIVR